MGNPRILIADPDTRAVSLTAHGLRKEGFEPVTTQRGEDALALLQSVPSVVFCDVRTPGVDGFSLCETARREPLTRDIPIFLLARPDNLSDHDRAKAVGADDYLLKPLYVRDVCTLAHLFAGRRSSEALIEGDLASTPLLYLLRALTSGERSGELEAPQERGVVHFRDGRAIEATCGELSGEAAMARLILLSQGPFRLSFADVTLRESICYSLRDLVDRDGPRRRQYDAALAEMGGPQVKLAIDLGALTRELPRLTPNLEKIARLFDGRRPLGEALREADRDEVAAADAVLRLFRQKVLQPADPGELPAIAIGRASSTRFS
jgi:CheY-like chemotaxis protein